VTEDVQFRAGAYQLHGELSYPEMKRARGAVVIAGPHPLLGGNMRNNVVRRLGDGLASAGLGTLRFDYQGVGRSEGPPVDVARHQAEFLKTTHAPGEQDFWHDLQAAVGFVRQTMPDAPVALVGYSFGCVLLPKVEPVEDLAALALIAPTIGKHDYAAFGSVQAPLLVVASEDDFATDIEQLETWLGTLTMPHQLVRQLCDNHFFRGHEDWLVEVVCRFLDGYWR
jgi:alpha/beta superfamily hydrolase